MVELLKQDKFTIDHIEDLRIRCDKQNQPIHSDFYSLHEQSIIADHLGHSSHFTMDGGYALAERKLITLYPTNEMEIESVPYCFLKVQLPKIGVTRKPNHRDILGALIHLGIDRRNIGDLLIFDEYIIVIVLDSIAPFIIEHLIKVGSVAVTVDYDEDINKWTSYQPSYKKNQTTIASNRLDNILKAGTKLTRSQSAAYVKSGKVFINGKEIKNISHELDEGDLISVRGIGKFKLATIGSTTKKGRIAIELHVYC